jgi:hypothetical protein
LSLREGFLCVSVDPLIKTDRVAWFPVIGQDTRRCYWWLLKLIVISSFHSVNHWTRRLCKNPRILIYFRLKNVIVLGNHEASIDLFFSLLLLPHHQKIIEISFPNSALNIQLASEHLASLKDNF